MSGAKALFQSIYDDFFRRDYFQEAFGYWCVDAGDVPGTLGTDIAARILVAVRKDDLWPISERLEGYEEHDLFDMMEFLYDHVSKPVDGYFHSFSGCGMHYSTFNRKEGQAEFRNSLNPTLAIYREGDTISDNGEIMNLPEKGMSPLTEANLPQHDPHNVDSRVEAAIVRFRRHHSSLEDRKHALRDLADVLEYLRPDIKNAI